ncbi:hypothetical protein DM02DRAFT_731609 [Periconia macrospinosa]|uniref:Zn(2)-C6 fungal-type domain-containing protein n=1 Tax=Periconia macrospinosa TaxID=97972 RepID=A0A2V1DCP1_9PLEO|nr:hypothetical protein DM02DRAFT_731609 [Periconia macrospinosa]
MFADDARKETGPYHLVYEEVHGEGIRIFAFHPGGNVTPLLTDMEGKEKAEWAVNGPKVKLDFMNGRYVDFTIGMDQLLQDQKAIEQHNLFKINLRANWGWRGVTSIDMYVHMIDVPSNFRAAMPTKPVKDSDRQRCHRACVNCARRKEKCSGQVPCARCRERCVAGSCHVPTSHANPSHSPRDSSSNSTSSIRCQGDAADSAFLQNIQHLTQGVVGDCDLFNNPLRYAMLDPTPPKRPAQWTTYLTQNGPPKPSLDEAKNLINTFLWVTTSVLDLLDESDLVPPLGPWATAPTGCEQHRHRDNIYFLIFAIAAQADPTDNESIAEEYFAYDRYLVACHYSEQPSITAVQFYMLIAMYLLTAARSDAAFMHTGLATRTAFALGLHRDDIAFSFPADQQIVR